MKKQFLLFCHEAIEELPDEAEWACNAVIQMCEDGGVFGSELPINEWEMNLGAGTGFGYKKKYPSKGHFYRENLPEQQEYLRKAHLVGAVPAMEVCPKVEYLTMQKILSGDQRCFEIYQVTHTGYQIHLCQKFNKNLYALGPDENYPVSIGVVFSQGGFHRLGMAFEEKDEDGNDQTNGMGDVSKWDKSLDHKWRRYCMRIRLAMYRGLNSNDYRIRMEWMYFWERYSIIILPWGQVVLMDNWMKSGSVLTSSDNTLTHLMVAIAYVKRHERQIGRIIVTWRDAMGVIHWYLYADDHLFRMSARLDFLASFARRCEFYRLCGFKLKEEDDKLVRGTALGLTFLGAEFRKVYGFYVPAFSVGRVWSSTVIESPLGELEAQDYFAKCRSLLLLLCGHGPSVYNYYKKNVVRKLVHMLDTDIKYSGWRKRKQSDDFFISSRVPDIPSFEWSFAFWTGSETSESDELRGDVIKSITGEAYLLYEH